MGAQQTILASAVKEKRPLLLLFEIRGQALDQERLARHLVRLAKAGTKAA